MIKNAYVLLEQFDEMDRPLIVKLYAEYANVKVEEKDFENFIRLANALDEHLSEDEKMYDRDYEEMEESKQSKTTLSKKQK